MVCSDEHKVLLGTPKLYEEAEYLWDNARKRLGVVGTSITWRTSRKSFWRRLKCVKFESDLRPKIKQFIGYQEIFQFSVLVNKCRIYNEDSQGRSAQHKNVSTKKSRNKNRGKPYGPPADKGKHNF
ncbi:uncharacterized protein LOC131649621 [Vicia villosa]|uniref:uncharacterized protein LOC131649621 n=1 Tax=Vicia villosa TaxID=3911 RepID=UPI00273C690E|nr:uncharacterized protein LOC131649621 [Vicia villosa]